MKVQCFYRRVRFTRVENNFHWHNDDDDGTDAAATRTALCRDNDDDDDDDHVEEDNYAWKWRNIFEYFMFLAHLSFHLIICEYFVYSPGFDENATKCQSETSGEKPSVDLKIIKRKNTVKGTVPRLSLVYYS